MHNQSPLTIDKNSRTYKHMLSKHFVAAIEGGDKVVYCPLVNNISFHPDDYAKRWCPACYHFFDTDTRGKQPITEKPLIILFPNYIELFKQLQHEYHLTSDWRFIRQHRLLNAMHRITKRYSQWFDDYMEKHK